MMANKWSIRVGWGGLIVRRPNGDVFGGVDTEKRHADMPEAVKLCHLAIKQDAIDREIKRVING